jgi:hypothetical protein
MQRFVGCGREMLIGSFGTYAGDSGDPVYRSYPGSRFVGASGIISYMWGTIQGSFTQPFANKG